MEERSMKEQKDIKTNNTPECVITKQAITKENIKNFYLLKYARNKRQSQAKNIKNSIMKGENPEAPIVVEKTQEKMLVIDGQHRLSAISDIIYKNPDFKIEVYIAVYKGPLSADQIRHIYTKWNSGVRQSISDLIWAHQDDIKMYERIVSELPCSVYGSVYDIKFKNLVEAEQLAIKSGNFLGGLIFSAQAFIQLAEKIKNEDVDLMKKFWMFIKKTFYINDGDKLAGNSSSVKHLLQSTSLNCLFRLWYVNKDRLGEEDMMNRLRNRKVRELLDEYGPMTGAKSCQAALDKIVICLNSHKTYTDNPSRQFYGSNM